MRTRSASASTRKVTVVCGRVNLKAFLQQISDHQREHLTIDLHHEPFVDGDTVK
jgi:hypothetical protein